MRRWPVLMVAGFATLAACDPSGPGVGPPATLSKEGALPASATVGEPFDSVRVAVEDSRGRRVAGATVAWTVTGGGALTAGQSETDAGGVARVGWTLGTAAGEQTLRAAVSGLDPVTWTVEGLPAAIHHLRLDPATSPVVFHALLDTVRIAAIPEDAYGNPRGDFVSWTTTDAGVASVAGGTVVSRGNGSVTVTAQTGGQTASVAVDVQQVPAALRVEGPYRVLAVSESWPYTATPVDSNGFALAGPVSTSWSSSNTAVLTVDGTGVATAVSTGTAQLTAAAPPLTGSLPLEVRAGPRPTITGIAPDPVRPGDTVAITGSGFDADLSGQTVTIAGVSAVVIEASPTLLRVLAPSADALPCVATAPRPFAVDVGGLESILDHPLAVTGGVTLAVGESVAFHGEDAGCNELTAPGTYVVTVFNSSTSSGTITGFELAGASPAGAAAAAALTPDADLAAFRPGLEMVQVDGPPPAVEARPEDLAHDRVLARNEELMARTRLGPVSPSLRMAAAPPAVGEIRSFRVQDLNGASCTDYTTITARAVYSGTYGVIFEDTLAPLAGTMDDTWAAIGAEVDDVMYPVVTQYFGDPLVYDDQLDADGRFYMVFSEVVNDIDRVAGFVWSGDMIPTCASGNGAEIFYGTVPTEPGEGYTGDTPATWRWGIRSTVIHEVKHITSYAYKFRDRGANGVPNYEARWLEESTARLAEEFYARALFGYGQDSNVTYQESIWCERRVGANWPDCDPYPIIMGKHFGGVNEYYGSIEQRSTLGPVNTSDVSYYGSGWLFVRWAVDQSGVPEADFIRALVDEDQLKGVPNILARTGGTFPDLLADFSLAVAADDHPSGTVPARPELAFRGWDTRDIFAGLHDDYSGTSLADTYPTPWPLRTHAVGSDFYLEVLEVRGGSAAVIEVTTDPAGGQLLQLLGSGGIVLPPRMGLAALRVQ
jgi:hypothetical protein